VVPAGPRQHVGTVDCGRVDRDEHLARSGHRIGQLDRLEPIGAAELTNEDGEHGSPVRPSRSATMMRPDQMRPGHHECSTDDTRQAREEIAQAWHVSGLPPL
jgi:hypothetical protein